MTRPVPTIALEFLKRAEALRLTAYADAGGVPTVGYGHTGPGVRLGLRITPAQAEAWLAEDAATAARRLAERVDDAVIGELSDHQYAALVSFAYNLGAGPRWTIWRTLNRRAFDETPGQMLRFDKVRGADGAVRTLPGLAHRRAAEVVLWRTPDVRTAAAVAAALPAPPSSQTRQAATPPRPAAAGPLRARAGFGTAVAAAVASAPVAVESVRAGAAQLSGAIAPYAERSDWLRQAVAALAVVGATMAALSVVSQWWAHRAQD